MMRKFYKNERKPIVSLIEFIKDLLELRREIDNKKLWYRGHASISYKLCPTIGRPNNYAGKHAEFSKNQERDLLHRFRRRTYIEFGRLLAAGEALFVARHHGLPTRLLDWTANALFGLYFACYDCQDKDGELWAIKSFDNIKNLDALKLAECECEKKLFSKLDGNNADENSEKSDIMRLKLVEPLYNSVRINAQDGAFTVQGNP